MKNKGMEFFLNNKKPAIITSKKVYDNYKNEICSYKEPLFVMKRQARIARIHPELRLKKLEEERNRHAQEGVPLKVKDSLLGYDIVDEFITFNDQEEEWGMDVVIFKNKADLDDYGTLDTREIGQLMGYPPTAIDAFQMRLKCDTNIGMNMLDSVTVCYHGLSFVAVVDTLPYIRAELESMYGLSAKGMKVIPFIL